MTGRAVRRTVMIVTAAAAGYAAPVGALELGTLTVHSHLNQPFNAIVTLTHLSASERAGLDVGIAPPDIFKRFGIRRSGAVDRMRIRIRFDKRRDRADVYLSTRHPVNEPFVDFVLRASTGNDNALREYTAMLDPGGRATTTPARARDKTATGVLSDVASNQSISAVGGRQARSRHVRSGETLWSIAAANTPKGASVAQTILAIYRANPSAFHGRMTALLAGATLHIPSPAAIRAVAEAPAKQHLSAAKSGQARARRPGPPSDSEIAAGGRAPAVSRKKKPSAEDEAKTKDPAGTQTDGKTETQSEAQGQAQTNDRPAAHVSGPAETAPDEANHKTADAEPTRARFGRLSLPSEAPWPTKPATVRTVPDNPKAGPAVSASSTAHGQPASAGDAMTVKAGDSSSGRTKAGDSPMAAGNIAPPPIDVAASDQGWLRPRNILILGLVIVLAIVAIRRRLRRGYESIDLETEADEPRRDPEPPVPAVRPPKNSDRDSPPGSSDAVTTTGSVPLEASAYPAAGAATFDRSRLPVPQAATAQGAPTTTDQAAKPAAETPAAAKRGPEPGQRATRISAVDSESAQDAIFSKPISCELAERDNTGDRLSMTDPVSAGAGGFSRQDETGSPNAAPGEEIPALAFASEPLPQAAERRHDHSGDRHNGLSFEAAEPLAGDRAENHAPPMDGTFARESSPEYQDTAGDDTGELKMIDPGEFDLYDPAVDTVAQAHHDSDDSVAIQLDLARLYIDMGDPAAARDLLEAVGERGDEDQQRAANAMLEQID